MVDFEKLRARFPGSEVEWRVGSTTQDKKRGLALAYIDSRAVMRRLDEACGPEGWQDSYTETARGRVVCTIRIKIGDEWIAKSDGAGDTAVEGEKGGISDAFKRAAVKWGIGRYLYDMETPWVALDQYKNIEKSELPRLRALADGKQAQAAPAPQTPRQQQMTPLQAYKFAIESARTQADLEAWMAKHRDEITHNLGEDDKKALRLVYAQKLAKLPIEGEAA